MKFQIRSFLKISNETASFDLKQKISLARAVYSNAEIYILDNPFSSYDIESEKKMFNELIGPNGLLNKKVNLKLIYLLTIFTYLLLKITFS